MASQGPRRFHISGPGMSATRMSYRYLSSGRGKDKDAIGAHVTQVKIADAMTVASSCYWLEDGNTQLARSHQ